MSIIRDYQEENDPRTDGLSPLPAVTTAAPTEPLPAPPIEPLAPQGQGQIPEIEPLQPDLLSGDSGTFPDAAQIDESNNVPADTSSGRSSLEMLAEGQSSLPGAIPAGAGGQPDYESTGETLEAPGSAQADALAQQIEQARLAQQAKPFESMYLDGSQFQSIYAAEESDKRRYEDESDKWFRTETAPTTVEGLQASKDFLRLSALVPNPNDTSFFNPDPLRNPFTNSAVINDTRNLYQKGLDSIAMAFGANYRQGDRPEFNPWRGYGQYAEEVKRNPMSLWKAPFIVPIAAGAARYGEMGDGYVGSLAYAASLVGNGLVGSAQTLYNIATGKIDRELKSPTLAQVFMGKDLSLTRESSEDTPLGYVGSKQSPRTLNELRDRSIIYKLNPALQLGIAAYKKATGSTGNEPIARVGTDHWGNSWLRYPEFVLGLATDIVLPGTPGEVGGWFNPKKVARGVPPAPARTLELIDPKAPKPAPQLPNSPKKVPDGEAIARKLVAEGVDNKPELARLEALQAQRNKFQSIPPQTVEEAIARGLVKPQRPKNVPPLVTVEAPKVKPPPRYTPPVQTVEAPEWFFAPPTPVEIVQHVAKEGGVIEPALVRQVVRTDEELTQLAVQNGDALPQSAPLHKKRLDMLYSTNPAYSRVGLAVQELPPLNQSPGVLTQAAPIKLGVESLTTYAPGLRGDVERLVEAVQTGNYRQVDDLTNTLTRVPDLVTRPELLFDVNKTLPEELQVLDPANAKWVQEYFQASDEFTTQSEVAAELDGILRAQKEVLIDALDELDNIGDPVGRSEIFNPIEYTPKYPAELVREMDTYMEATRNTVPTPRGQEPVDIEVPPPLESTPTDSLADELADIWIERQSAVGFGKETVGDTYAIRKGEILGNLELPLGSKDELNAYSIKGVYAEPELRPLFTEAFKKLGGVSDEAANELASAWIPKVVNGNSDDTLVNSYLLLKRKHLPFGKGGADALNDYLIRGIWEEPVVKNLIRSKYREILSRNSRPSGIVTAPIVSAVPKHYHGSKVRNLDLTAVDPLVGGARGELGVGTYLTTNKVYAEDYAKATPAVNVPDLETRQYDEVGAVYEVAPEIKTPFDAGATGGLMYDLRQGVEGAVESSLFDDATKKQLARVFRSNVSYESMLSQAEKTVAKNYGEVPENLILDLHRKLTEAFRASGYDAITKGEVVNYIGNPKKLQATNVERLGVGDLLEGAIHRYNADQRSAEYFPDSAYARHNSKQSTANLIYHAAQHTQDMFDDAQQKAVRLADIARDKEKILKKVAAEELANKKAAKLAAARKQDELMVQHNNIIDDNPCL